MSTLDFVSRVNADYVEAQYQRYRVDPSSVDERWALFFAGFEMAVDGNGRGPNGDAPQLARRWPTPRPDAAPNPWSGFSTWCTPTASSATSSPT